MHTLNIWEVRAEAGKKEPYLDVTANVVASDFTTALDTLVALIAEKVAQHPELVAPTDYEILCIRLIQQVKTIEAPCLSSPSAT